MICTIEPTQDFEQITSILTDNEMWPRISEDGQNKDEFIVSENAGFLWFGVFAEDGEMVGVFFFHYLNLSTFQAHIHILEKHRKDYAKCSIIGMLEYFVHKISHRVNKIVLEIPVIYPDVYHFTKKYGFYDEGVNKDSIYKGGKFVDQYRLGITKGEAETWLQQQ